MAFGIGGVDGSGQGIEQLAEAPLALREEVVLVVRCKRHNVGFAGCDGPLQFAFQKPHAFVHLAPKNLQNVVPHFHINFTPILKLATVTLVSLAEQQIDTIDLVTASTIWVEAAHPRRHRAKCPFQPPAGRPMPGNPAVQDRRRNRGQPARVRRHARHRPRHLGGTRRPRRGAAHAQAPARARVNFIDTADSYGPTSPRS